VLHYQACRRCRSTAHGFQCMFQQGKPRQLQQPAYLIIAQQAAARELAIILVCVVLAMICRWSNKSKRLAMKRKNVLRSKSSYIFVCVVLAVVCRWSNTSRTAGL